MPISLPRAALALGLLLTPAALMAQEADKPAPAAELKTTTHGAWTVVCSTDAKARCVMEQIGKTAEGQDILMARLQHVPPQDSPEGTINTVISVQVPLGVMLQAGLALQIDSGKASAVGYTRCSQDGCFMQSPLPGAMVAAMKKGVNAKFSMVLPPNKRVDSTLSLSGFTAAYNALSK